MLRTADFGGGASRSSLRPRRAERASTKTLRHSSRCWRLPRPCPPRRRGWKRSPTSTEPCRPASPSRTRAASSSATRTGATPCPSPWARSRTARPSPIRTPQVNKINKRHPAACLYSVQSVVVDPKDRLWALDTGSVKLGPNVPDGPKLVCMDLKTNTITRKIILPARGRAAGDLPERRPVRSAARQGRHGVHYRLGGQRPRTASSSWTWRPARAGGG